MEIRLNLVLLAVLAISWSALSPSHPVAALDPESEATRELAMLEDEFARDRGDVLMARHLASRYLELDRPGLAIAILNAGEPRVLQDPTVTHRLAQAYEATGRLDDALATAELAHSRCGRYLGTTENGAVTPLPRHRCDFRDYAMLEMHRNALRHITRGMTPSLAYDVALRRVSIASAAP